MPLVTTEKVHLQYAHIECEIVHMSVKNGTSEHIGMPHWLNGDSYSERGRRKIDNMHRVLKVVALNAPLSVYAIHKRIDNGNNKGITHSTISRYVWQLEQNGLLEITEAGDKRKTKMCIVPTSTIAYLYFQHYLTKGEIVQIIRHKLSSYELSVLFEIQDEETISKHVEEYLSRDFITSLAGLHFPKRVEETHDKYSDQLDMHIEGTWWRDFILKLLIEGLCDLKNDGDRLEKLRKKLSSNDMLEFLSVAKDIFTEMKTSFSDEVEKFGAAMDTIDTLLQKDMSKKN